MNKSITIAIAIFLGAFCLNAGAIIVVGPQTVSYVGISDDTPQPNNLLDITYEVDEIQAGVYLYNYELQTIDPAALTSFTIGGAHDPINTTGMAMLNYGHADANDSGFNSDSVGWDWGFRSDITSDEVSFTSDVAPGYAGFTANDDDIEWSSPALLPAPVPEPTAFALLAASAFAFCLFKDRLRVR